MLSNNQKSNIIKKFKAHATDTGSAKVQVALLTSEIAKLASHLKKHLKDNHSRRGLLKMVAKRKKLLNYLQKNDLTAYRSVVRKLELKKKKKK